jgi:hypothetical protein
MKGGLMIFISISLKKLNGLKTIYEKRHHSPVIVIFAICIILVISILMIFKGNRISNPFLGFICNGRSNFLLEKYFEV